MTAHELIQEITTLLPHLDALNKAARTLVYDAATFIGTASTDLIRARDTLYRQAYDELARKQKKEVPN